MPTYKFVDNSEELYQSVIEYNKDAKYFRELIGNAPKYFVISKQNGQLLFGLSKFCAFKDISIEAYIRKFRYITDGGTTQQHISRLTCLNWVRYKDMKANIQSEFKQWIHSFFPNYNVENASFITLSSIDKSKFKPKISQDELEVILEYKKLIGKVGEEIALAYEMERLNKLGDKTPHDHVVHTALNDVNAGYDIFSDYNKVTRLIEVKTMINTSGDMYLTRNELENLNNNIGKAFVYVVNITDLKAKIGKVVREINKIEDLGTLEPVLFKIIK